LSPVLNVFLRRGSIGVLIDPVADVFWEPLVELVEVLRDDEPVVPDVVTVFDREGIGVVGLIFNRKIGKIDGLFWNFGSVRKHYMRWFSSHQIAWLRAARESNHESTKEDDLAANSNPSNVNTTVIVRCDVNRPPVRKGMVFGLSETPQVLIFQCDR